MTSTTRLRDDDAGSADPQGDDQAGGKPPSIQQIMLRFQSLGDNCEFGIVQRCCGCEPLGLFRFVHSSIPELVAALDEDFSSYGAKDDLTIHTGDGFYWCTSRRHHFAHATGQRVGSLDPETVLRREYTKIAFLKRSMREELAEGHKIFVRKGAASESLDAFLSLAAALRRRGPSVVLRVEPAPSREQVGRVAWHAPGVMVGYVRRFSPYEGGMDIDLEPWVELCRNAYALAFGVPVPEMQESARGVSLRAGRRAIGHRTRHRKNRLSTFAARASAAQISPGRITAFSAWIWLPRDFDGERVFAFVKIGENYERLAGRDADPTLREAWQRIWVSVQLPPRPMRIVLGIAVTGPGSQRFWSTDWQIGEDPFPPAAPAPTLPVRHSLWRRLFG